MEIKICSGPFGMSPNGSLLARSVPLWSNLWLIFDRAAAGVQFRAKMSDMLSAVTRISAALPRTLSVCRFGHGALWRDVCLLLNFAPKLNEKKLTGTRDSNV
jgi:hypothetical protein